MKKRASVVLDAETYERLQHRARRHRRSVSDEIRAAVDDALAAEVAPAEVVENPNAGWEALIGIIDGELPGVPPTSSPDFKPWLRASITDEAERGMRART